MLNKRLLPLSVVIGLVAAGLAAIYLHIKEAELAGGSEFKRVFVAAADIKQNTLIEPGLLRVKKIPQVYTEPGSLNNMDAILGRVSITRIKKGEQITGSKLIMSGAASGVASKIPAGKRAVSIAVDNYRCAGGLIAPDDYVDIVVTFDYGENDQSNRYTFTLFQDVPVLAVGLNTYSIRNPSSVAASQQKTNEFFGAEYSDQKMTSGKKVFTFALTPNEAEKLIFASGTGEMSLILRSTDDRAIYVSGSPIEGSSLTGKSIPIRKRFKEYRGR